MCIIFDSYVRHNFYKNQGETAYKLKMLLAQLLSQRTRCEGFHRTYCIVSPTPWMITQYKITNHSRHSWKHAKKVLEIRIWASLYSLYCFIENMNDYTIPADTLFFKFAKFSETDLHILGMMPKRGVSNFNITSG